MGSSTERVILVCEQCAERTVLGGPLWVWRSGRAFFECECGNLLTLADRLDKPGPGTEVGSVASATNAATPVPSTLYVTAEGIMSVIAAVGLLVALAACAVGYYLAASV